MKSKHQICTVIAKETLDGSLWPALIEKAYAYDIKLSTETVVLSTKKAVEGVIEGPVDKEAIEAFWALCEPYKADIFITPATARRKKLLVADMDSTVVVGETLDDLAAHFGLKDKVAAITTRAMRGELDFAMAIDERVKLLKDLPEAAVAEAVASTVINAGAKTLVRTMQAHGAFCALVSGGFTVFTDAVARDCGFDIHHGNELIVERGCLTGVVGKPLLDREAKERLLKECANQHNLTAEQTMAVGDGANDLAMLQTAGLGVGYKPKPLLTKSLSNNIFYNDLTALLYLQGYKDEEVHWCD